MNNLFASSHDVKSGVTISNVLENINSRILADTKSVNLSSGISVALANVNSIVDGTRSINLCRQAASVYTSDIKLQVTQPAYIPPIYTQEELDDKIALAVVDAISEEKASNYTQKELDFLRDKAVTEARAEEKAKTKVKMTKLRAKLRAEAQAEAQAKSERIKNNALSKVAKKNKQKGKRKPNEIQPRGEGWKCW